MERGGVPSSEDTMRSVPCLVVTYEHSDQVSTYVARDLKELRTFLHGVVDNLAGSAKLEITTAAVLLSKDSK